MFTIEDLIKKAKSGHQHSMNKIVDKFMYFIIKKAGKYKIPSYDFEDLVQHGCLSVIKAVHLYKIGSSSFTSYCTNSVVNNFNALLKSQIKHYREVQDSDILGMQSYDFTLEDEITAYEETERIEASMSELTDIERNIIRSVYIKDRTLKKTAEDLKIKYRHAIDIRKSALKKMKKYFR